MILRGRDITASLKETADVIIIGSGCGGGPCAKILAASGRRVLLVEEGGYYTPSDFDGTEETAYTNLYQRRAGQATDDLGITILQGRCVGGSSTVNWMTSLRPPEFTLDVWRRRFRLEGLGPEELDPYFSRVESYLHVRPEPDDQHNANNRILLDGGRALGYRTRATGRNADNCVHSGACGLGCPYDAKRSVDRTYILDADAAGATILADCRAEKIEVQGPLKRVTCHLLDARRRQHAEASFEAPVVIVSASAINSPVLLLKSALPNTNGEIGRNLTLHLTTAVVSSFDRTIDPGSGIPQSVMCDEFLNKNGDNGGFWIEAVPVYPALAALALPGFGSAHRDLMKNYRQLGASIILLKEIDSSGQVTVNSHGHASITYQPGPRDMSYLREGVAQTGRIHLAAGARSVMTVHASPRVMNAGGNINQWLDDARWEMNDLALFSAHPLGTCRMARDPRMGVVDNHCQMHAVPGLFVVDGSVVPTALGVNPQVTILAIAEKTAEWIAENYATVAR
jgi:choline dehydrogenase-like flavoprotein